MKPCHGDCAYFEHDEDEQPPVACNEPKPTLPKGWMLVANVDLDLLICNGCDHLAGCHA